MLSQALIRKIRKLHHENSIFITTNCCLLAFKEGRNKEVQKKDSVGSDAYYLGQYQTSGPEQRINITFRAGRLLPHTLPLKAQLPMGRGKTHNNFLDVLTHTNFGMS